MVDITDKEKRVLTDLVSMELISTDKKKVLKGILDRIENKRSIELYVDGAADLHSKTAGIGGVLFQNEEELFTFSKPIFDKTNNEAEYLALIEGLNVSLELNILNIVIYSDSQLIVRQVNGEYRVKNDRMRLLNSEVIDLLCRFNEWSINHINRDKNKVADKLSKEGMKLARVQTLGK